MTTCSPPYSIVPSSIGWMPAMHLISVDLPAPLSPTSAIVSPARTSKSTSFSAWTEPNDFETFRSSRSGVSLIRGGEGREATLDEPPPEHQSAYLQYCV